MYFDASISPNDAPLAANHRSRDAAAAPPAFFARSYEYAASRRKSVRNVSSLPMRLIAAAFASSAQRSDAHMPTVESNNCSASRNTRAVVATPASAFGSRSAASGEIVAMAARRSWAFHHAAASSDAQSA